MIALKLSSEIYSLKKIDLTKNIFFEYADIIVKKEDDYWVLYFFNCKYDKIITIREFENYLIDLENS